MRDESYDEAMKRVRREERESWAARIHAAAHKDIVEGCEDCQSDAEYLDNLSLDEINRRLDASIDEARR